MPPDTRIGLRMLIVATGPEQHGRSPGFDQLREMPTRSIQQLSELNAHPVAQSQIQRFLACLPGEVVQVIHHLPDFLQLPIATQIRRPYPSQIRQSPIGH